MTWDHHGRRIEDEDEAADRAAEVMSGDDIQSALDRVNLVWLIDAYAGQKLMLLLRMVTAGRAACWLSSQRLARDCNMEPRTVERYRSALVEDGVLERETTDDGRTAFWINWGRLVELACHGLMRRPVKERLAIMARILGPIINRNALPIDRRWWERWSDRAAKPADIPPAHFKRKRQNPSLRQGIHAPRQGIPDADNVSAPPDTMPGPSKPELNPNPEPESQNGPLNGPLDADSCGHIAKQLGGIQVEYAGKPTLIARVLELLYLDGKPLPRAEIARAALGDAGQVGRTLGELCRRGYAERIDHGWYVITSAGSAVGREVQRAWRQRLQALGGRK